MSTSPRRTLAAPLSGVLLLGCLALAACGSSSKSPSANASARTATVQTLAATRTTAARPGAHASGGSAKGQHGGTQAPGARAAGGAGASAHASSGAHHSGSHASKPQPHQYSPALKSAILALVGCMRQHGIKLPAPNFNGKPSEILSSKGVDTKSPQFQSAMNACGTDLLAILRAGGASLPGATH